MRGLSAEEIAAYWAIEKLGPESKETSPNDHTWADAFDRLIDGDNDSLTVFRQLFDTAPSETARAHLLVNYLEYLPWTDDTDFSSWLQSLEAASGDDAETLREMRKYSPNNELPSKPTPALKRKGERWKKNDPAPE